MTRVDVKSTVEAENFETNPNTAKATDRNRFQRT